MGRLHQGSKEWPEFYVTLPMIICGQNFLLLISETCIANLATIGFCESLALHDFEKQSDKYLKHLW